MLTPRYKTETGAQFVGSLNQYDLYFFQHACCGLVVTEDNDGTGNTVLTNDNDDALLDLLYNEALIRFERLNLPLIEVCEVSHA